MMNIFDEISIIIPTFYPGNIINKCLETLPKNVDIIIIDNGNDEDLINLIKNKANSSTDISDGLLNDLKNICDMSNLGAEISFSSIPKSKEVIKFLNTFKRYEKLILTGGDDYQLLFTGPKGLNRYKNVTEIGRMTRNKGIKIIDKNFNNLLSGYNHSIY